ncbi:YiiX/YebB-like N1pC/P60 family cysteine hydrolase [Myroides sp. LJL116]
MVSEYQARKVKVFLLCCISFLFLCCNNKEIKPLSKQNELACSSFEQANLNNGDIVFRLGTGYFSNFFRKYASQEKEFSHVGLVQRENDSLFVIHIEASEFTGVGYVKKETLTSFLSQSKSHRFYYNTLDSATKEKIVTQALTYYKAHVPFDLEFNSEDDSALYCSELIAHSINKGLDSIIIRPTLQLGDKLLYGLDDVYGGEFLVED